MSDEQSVEDLAEKIMGVAIRTGQGISTVNAEEQILKLLQSRQPISVTDEWIEEKAERFMLQCPGGMLHRWASVKRFIEDFIRSLVKVMPEISEDWLPTPENINALPEPVRKYIHDIETNTDPAHVVRENILIKDTCKMLVLKLEEKKKITKSEEWIEEKARELSKLSAYSDGQGVTYFKDTKVFKDFIRSFVKEIGKG